MRPLSILASVILAAAATAQPSNGRPPQSPGFVRAYLDTTCSPCRNFWRFANGAWIDSVTIPPDAADWGRDAMMRQRSTAVIRELLDSLAYAPTRHARSPQDRNVGAFFRACMDTTLSPARQRAPLAPELQRLAAIATKSDVSAAVGRLTRAGLSPFFWFVVVEEVGAERRAIAEVRGVFGWSMPSRMAYVTQDSASARMREAYVAMLTRVFGLLGDGEAAAANARRVLELETALVRSQPRDSGGVNEKRSLAELESLAPSFDWRAFAMGLGRADLPPVLMRTHARATVDSLTRDLSVEHWRAYLRWKYVLSLVQVLDRQLSAAIGEFFALAFGRQAMPPRAPQCVALTTNVVGDDVARSYVARAFSASDRAAALALAEQVRVTFRELMRTADWLDSTTRRRAVAKLDATRLWIGYPDRWESGPTLTSGPATAMLLEARRSRMDRTIASIGGVVDGDRWLEANAAFLDVSGYPVRNAVLLTAAALQRPAFDPGADIVTNLANIGWGFGHELAHGFDTRGRFHNERGAREDWWSAEAAREYARRADLIAEQYSQYIAIDSIRVNGRRSLGENIADIGAATLAYETFRRVTAGEPSVVVDGFTREQRFFIALAQAFPRIASRPQQLRNLSESAYAPPEWRLNGALANVPGFAAAFGCKEGDPMVLPAARSGRLW